MVELHYLHYQRANLFKICVPFTKKKKIAATALSSLDGAEVEDLFKEIEVTHFNCQGRETFLAYCCIR